jgi:hypothetical protein
MDRRSGQAYQHLEKVEYLLERKAWEDIFLTLKGMVNEGFMDGRQDYYLFYRIFAFSFFETVYPGLARKNLNEVEQKAARARFQYVSGFINRFLIVSEVYREERIPQVRVRRLLKNCLGFGLAVFSVGGLVQFALSLLAGGTRIDLLPMVTDWIAAQSGRLYRAVLDFSAGSPGIFALTLAVGLAVALLFVLFFLYRLTTGLLGRFSVWLRNRSALFFVLTNMLVFALAFNFILEAGAWLHQSGQRERVMLVVNDRASGTLRRDDFLDRFLVEQKLYARYRVDTVAIDTLNARLADTDPAKALALRAELGAYGRVVFAVTPFSLLPGAEYRAENFSIDALTEALVAVWKESGRDLSMVFLYPFTGKAPDGFAALPALDHLGVKVCAGEYGTYGIAYLPKDEELPSGVSRTALFGLKSASDLEELMKKLTGANRGKAITDKDVLSNINIDYYYDFGVKPAGNRALPDEAEFAAMFLPLVRVRSVMEADEGAARPTAGFLYELGDGAVAAKSREAYGLSKAGQLRVVSIDQKFLLQNSGLGDLLAARFFYPEQEHAAPWLIDPRVVLALTQVLVLLLVLLLVVSITWIPFGRRLAVFAAALASQLPLATLFLGGDALWSAVGLSALWGGSLGVVVISALGLFFLFALGQIAGLQPNKQLQVYVWVPAAANLVYWLAGLAVCLDPEALYLFLTGDWGVAFQLALTAAVGVLSWRYFSFKLKIQ